MLEKLATKGEVQMIDLFIHVSFKNVTSNTTEQLDLDLNDSVNVNN